VSPAELEQILRNLPERGKLVKDRGYRKLWHFEYKGRGYYLKFYPRGYSQLRRLFRGSPANWEFVRLQALQKAAVPAPRAVAELVGLRLDGELGDAVVLEAIEPAVSMDQYITKLLLDGAEIPHRRKLAEKIYQMLHRLGKAKLGHNDLHLGNMLLKNGEIYLLDAYAVRFGGLTTKDVMGIAHGVSRVATRTDLLRGWKKLEAGVPMPRKNTIAPRLRRKFLERTSRENDQFGLLAMGDWSGVYFKRARYPRRWGPASQLTVSGQDWEKEWPQLWEQIESGKMEVLKSSPSGDVLAGEIPLGAQQISIVVKRPFRRHWYRYLNEIGRGSRAWRAWRKAWALVARDIPTAWPLLVLQKRKFGYITDAVLVCQRVIGSTLDHADLNAMEPKQRDMLFRRTGAVLRRIDDTGMGHFDAKSANWIVQEDEKQGLRPILIDVDGIRFRRWRGMGMGRLIRSLELHPQHDPADVLALRKGYAPFSSTRDKGK
jgi:tRNA A-37 threonylcarbamoyl transferase component Bud32